MLGGFFFFFSSRRRHTRCSRDWSSDVCSSDLRNTRSSARDVLADDLVFLDHRTHERSQLDIRANAVHCAVYVTDRDASPLDCREHGSRRIRSIAGDAADRDCGNYMGRREDLQSWDTDDGQTADDERTSKVGQGLTTTEDMQKLGWRRTAVLSEKGSGRAEMIQ